MHQATMRESKETEKSWCLSRESWSESGTVAFCVEGSPGLVRFSGLSGPRRLLASIRCIGKETLDSGLHSRV